MISFFLKYVGDLNIIVLREEKCQKPKIARYNDQTNLKHLLRPINASIGTIKAYN
jgi:hypothetical protein